MTEREALKRITRDDTEHGKYYYLADEVDALLAQPEERNFCPRCGKLEVIYRYHETMPVATVLGVLEIIKAQLIAEHTEREEDE